MQINDEDRFIEIIDWTVLYIYGHFNSHCI